MDDHGSITCMAQGRTRALPHLASARHQSNLPSLPAYAQLSSSALRLAVTLGEAWVVRRDAARAASYP